MAYHKESLVTDIRASHPGLKVNLQLNDAVLDDKNIFLRQVAVTRFC